MAGYGYICPNCGPFDSHIPADRLDCRCGASAKRIWRIGVIRSSLKPEGRFDPVVGEYVTSHADFRSKLARGQDREAESLGMDVKLATVDARDTEGLAELHGHTPDQRAADLEGTQKLAHAKANA